MSLCPLCGEAVGERYTEDARRSYLRCSVCALVFVPPEHLPSAAEERAQYDLHENDPNDEGYRRFLSRVFLPMRARLQPGARGLDFGSGPGPTLSLMFEEAGFEMDIYDPFYAPNPDVFEQRYDFITATEVVEHLHRPGEELRRLVDCLVDGGHLGIMTKRVRDREAFAGWHYKNDPTHVSFFSEETFLWIAHRFGIALEVESDDVVVFSKRA